MPDESQFKEHDRVCLRYDPGRHGRITGRTRERAGDTFWQVEFLDGSDYEPGYELEHVTRKPDWEELIKNRRFGRSSDLRRNLCHIQLSGKLSSLIYSLDTTNTEFYPYQFKPVLAFLESPCRGLLIADEVGLGKTIEAGLIWTELRARHDARRLLVVCPAVLCDKWQYELRDRFGIDAIIMDSSELLKVLEQNQEHIPDGKGIICSMQSIRPPRGWQDQNQGKPRYQLARFLAEQATSQLIDLLIIDEAHHLRNRETQNARLGQMLREVSENVLLLSATPINLKSEDLFSLLHLLDPDTFNVPDFFPDVLRANEPLLKAKKLVLDQTVGTKRIMGCLAEAVGHNLLADNQQLQLIIETLQKPGSVDTTANRVTLADRIDRVNLLRHVVSRTRKVEVTEWRVVRKPKSLFVELEEDGVEAQFYRDVTASIRAYARENNIRDGFLLANPQRQVSSCMYAAAKSWSDRAYLTGAHADEFLYENFGDIEADSTNATKPLLEHLTSTILPSLNLQQLRNHDSKFNKFHQTIEKYFKQYPQEKIVVFSYFRGTLSYLEKRLTEHGIASQVLMGGMPESKQDAIHRFRDTPSTSILLSSEVASEGVDLQFCRMIVNYDLPWNPMKIEQRIGRLDRIGQQSNTINIYNFGYADTIDHRIYERLFDRLKIFERALGGLDAMLGEQVKNLTNDLFTHQLTPQQENERIAQTAFAIENNLREEKELEKNAANLIAHGGYILAQVRAAHNLRKKINEDDLVVYVKDYLNRHAVGHEFQQSSGATLRFNIRLPAATAVDLANFIKEKRLRGQTRLGTGDQVRCEFINKIGGTSGGVERISQFHPLVRFISKKISESDEGFFPVVAVKFPPEANDTGLDLPNGQYAFVIRKWEFVGLRAEADLYARVIHLESDLEVSTDDSWKLLNAVRLGGSDWPEAITEAHPDRLAKLHVCFDYLETEFQDAREIKETENTDRVNFQILSAQRYRDRQVDSLQRVLENYISRNQTRMIPATKARIEKITTRFDVQIEQLRSKETMTARNLLVCCGLLLLK